MFNIKTKSKSTIQNRIINNTRTEDDFQVLKRLKSLVRVDSNKFKIVKREYYFRKSGISGEASVLRELKYCDSVPIYVLHNITLPNHVVGEDSQIDFIVITQSNIFIMECKNFLNSCTVKINSDGEFIKTDQHGNEARMLPDPYEQNEKHLKTIYSLIEESNNKLLIKCKERGLIKNLCVFSGNVIPITLYAPTSIKETIVMESKLGDKLNSFGKKKLFNKKTMDDILNFFIENQVEHKTTDWYQRLNINSEDLIDFSELLVYKELLSYRTHKYKSENVKAYEIFNNNQLLSLIKYNPQTLEDIYLLPAIKEIDKFKTTQVLKYGNDIIEILKKYN